MIHLIRSERILSAVPELLVQDEEKKILVFLRKSCIFALNFSATGSFADYGFAAPAGKWVNILDTDEPRFNGFGRIVSGESHFTVAEKSPNGNPRYEDTLYLYLPARSAVVLKKL